MTSRDPGIASFIIFILKIQHLKSKFKTKNYNIFQKSISICNNLSYRTNCHQSGSYEGVPETSEGREGNSLYTQ